VTDVYRFTDDVLRLSCELVMSSKCPVTVTVSYRNKLCDRLSLLQTDLSSSVSSPQS